MSLLTLWQCVHAWPQAPEVGLSHGFIGRDPLLRLVLKFVKRARSAIGPFTRAGFTDAHFQEGHQQIDAIVVQPGGGTGGGGRGGRERKKGRSAEVGAKMLAALEEGNSQLFHRISFAGSDREHTLLTKHS